MGKGHRVGKQICINCGNEVDETWFGKCGACL